MSSPVSSDPEPASSEEDQCQYRIAVVISAGHFSPETARFWLATVVLSAGSLSDRIQFAVVY